MDCLQIIKFFEEILYAKDAVDARRAMVEAQTWLETQDSEGAKENTHKANGLHEAADANGEEAYES